VAIYALVLIAVCIGCALGSGAPTGQQRALAAPLILVLAAFASLRGYVGTDTYAYHEMFQDFRQDSLLEIAGAVEPVFAAIIKMVSSVSKSSFIFVGVVAIIQSVVLYAIIVRHSQPLLFLGLYTATFYINFQFNILRAGLAALLLVLALSYTLGGSRLKSFGSGLLSMLSHYSSVLFLVPISLIGQKFRWGMVWLLASLLVGGLVIWTLVGEGRWVQYLSYLVLYDADDSVQYGFGLFVAFGLYAIIFSLQVTRQNVIMLLAIFLLWYFTRLASNYFMFVDRIEIVVNIILLYLVSQKPDRRRNQTSVTIACMMLIALNLYGSLKGLEAADLSTRGASAAEFGRISSTYLPYRFAWEE
jgi:hypothetical protein